MQNAGTKDYVVVTAPPSFSMKWLVPRLENFQEAHPEIEVRIDARDELTDFKNGWADVGIRYGTGKYSDLHVEPLFDDAYFPVCSAQLVERHGRRPLKLADLKHHRLLHVDWPALASAAPNWQMWLQAAKISHPDAHTGHRFTSEMMALDAAISGFGIALVSSRIAAIDMAAGRLVRVFADQAPIRTGFRYYLVRPNDTKPRKDVVQFLRLAGETPLIVDVPLPKEVGVYAFAHRSFSGDGTVTVHFWSFPVCLAFSRHAKISPPPAS